MSVAGEALVFWLTILLLVAGSIAIAYCQLHEEGQENPCYASCAFWCETYRTELYPQDRPTCINDCVARRRDNGSP